MKTIISASRRTDIPAFYLKWFMNAISKKSIKIQNPFYKKNFYTVDLSPDSVKWIVFWSRNYKSFLKNYQFFNEYNLFFHFTIISHHPLLEKNSLPLNQSLKQVEKLVSLFGPERIIWRYDPIVLWSNGDKLETNFNLKEFQLICKEMNSFGITQCYFSFVNQYSKFKKRFKQKYPDLTLTNATEHIPNILDRIKEIAAAYKIALYSCCNEGLIDENIKKGNCISGELLNSLLRQKTVSEAKSPSRKDCGCTKSIDIGNYDHQPCYFGCIYCYANPVWK